MIFGRVDQARHILKETFDGTPILLNGPDGNTIDCMFFPCTTKEKVRIDESVTIDGQKADHAESTTFFSAEEKEPEYLSKATVIICNPNALYYQQMVTSPNAYWLNFFLKRDINVMCWNYRGYGQST